jgi:hypothetical protein
MTSATDNGLVDLAARVGRIDGRDAAGERRADRLFSPGDSIARVV